MPRVCQVTGKRPMTGNNVSHANNKTKRRFHPNLQEHRIWLASQKRFVRLRLSKKGLRIIDKYGIEAIYKYGVDFIAKHGIEKVLKNIKEHAKEQE